MQDSILHKADSLNQGLDSLQFNLPADTLAVADSLKMIISPPLGMEGIIHPWSPGNETWVFIVIGVLFFFLVTGIIQSAGTFIQKFQSFFSKKDSVNLIVNPTTNIAQFQLFITLFTICVFALTAHEFTYQAQYPFRFVDFSLFCGLFLGFYALKHILFEMVGNTFFDHKITKSYKSMYFSLFNIVAILLFPILILFTYQPVSWHQPLIITALSVLGLFYIVLIIKLFQIFYTKPLALFYIFLYLCTLEILPILILIRASEKFIKYISL